MNIFQGLDDYKWLFIQAQRPTDEFNNVASGIELSQRDWSKFWKEIEQKLVTIAMHEKDIKNIDVELPCGKRMIINNEELTFIKETFGEPKYNFRKNR